ncbi:hypothetical protein QBC41DRAFT_300788 [Cercophora samala]|uniref:Uncharacterized protein n=1 Tax=Cercophora samala TaxID=330535 RepID=A0AA39ZHJ2_9PEZI|nr:hypothetical protein QBC41DRAFT_300788 [Cercophora samala]
MNSSKLSTATDDLTTMTLPGASAANIEALNACSRLKQEYLNAASSAPHMAALRDLVAKSIPYGEEDSWSSSECSRAWSPYGAVQRRRIRPSTTAGLNPYQSQELAEEEKAILCADNFDGDTVSKSHHQNVLEYLDQLGQSSHQGDLSRDQDEVAGTKDKALKEPSVRPSFSTGLYGDKVARRYGIEHYLHHAQPNPQDSRGTKSRQDTEPLTMGDHPVNEDLPSQSLPQNNYTVVDQPSHCPLQSQKDIDQHLTFTGQHQPELGYPSKVDPQELGTESSDPETNNDSTPSITSTDSSNPTTVTSIPTGGGTTLSFAFRPTDQTAVWDGKLGVVRDFENEEWQCEIKDGIAEGLSRCTWHKLSVPPTQTGTATTSKNGGEVPILKLTTPEGQEHGLMDLTYYQGQDWADLDDDEDY